MKYTSFSSNEIFDDLCDKIRKLELEPGLRISENEMAALYNVSRSIVRKAFSKLEQIHLLEVYPQIGTFVSTFDMEYIYDALYVRHLVELDVLEDVINLEDKTELIKKLEDNLRIQEKFRGETNYEFEFKKIDYDFHEAILDSVHKRRIMEIIDDSFIHIARWRNFDLRCRKRLNMLIDEHILLLQAIKQNDKKLAKETMKKHLLNINNDFLSQAKSDYPNYFL